MKRPLAYLTAAWSGEPDVDMELAAHYCRLAYEAGFSPICPLLYLPLFLNDSVPPRTIPAFPHLPEGGIGTSVSEKADKTALKSIRSFVENAPMTFSQTAIAGYRLSVASLISCMIRNA